MSDETAPHLVEQDHTGPTWCVHVIGPDDVIEQPDRATAVKVAHAINSDYAALGAEVHNDPMWPTVWAVVTTLEAQP